MQDPIAAKMSPGRAALAAGVDFQIAHARILRSRAGS
jgi:hypothetical protein